MTSKQNNKKNSARTNKQRRKGQSVPNTPSMLVTRRAVLTWAGKVNLTEGGVSAGAYNFYRINGAYDPDASGVGNATPGLSSMYSLFRSMRVHKMTIHFDGTVYTTGAGFQYVPLLSFVPTSFQPVLPSNPDYWSVQRMAQPLRLTSGLNYAGGQVGYSFSGSATYIPHVVANLTRAQYEDEADFASPANSTPTRQLYVALALSSNATSACNMGGLVRISYDLEFYDPWPLQ